MPQGTDKKLHIGNSQEPVHRFPQGKNHLLIIGIDSYGNGIPPLYNAVRDAEAFKELMLKEYQFNTNDLTLLINKDASKANIIKHFDELLARLTSEDNLVFYFTGHGELHAPTNRGYWIPADAIAGRRDTYLSNSDVIDFIQSLQVRHVFGIVDSCFSAALFSQKSMSIGEMRHYSLPSRWLLTAGRLEPVSDGSLGENSPFAQALLAQLSHHPEDLFWSADLCSRVLKGVIFNTAKQLPRGEPLQNAGHQGGEFVFLRKNVRVEDILSPMTPSALVPEKLVVNSPTGPANPSTSPTEIGKPSPMPKGMNLKEVVKKLKELAAKNLDQALDTLDKNLTDHSTYRNDLIMLKGQYNNLKGDQRRGIIGSNDATLRHNRIMFSFFSLLDSLEAQDLNWKEEGGPSLSYHSNTEGDISLDLRKLEQEGLKNQAELLVRKLNTLNEALILETDASRKFQYEMEIEKLEKQLIDLKNRLL